MDLHNRIDNEITVLSLEIQNMPDNTELYMERGRLYYKNGNFGGALNDFMRVQALDSSLMEAQQYIAMIREILEFRYTDIYNP